MTITNTGRRLAFVGLVAMIAALLPLSTAQAAHLTGVTQLTADDNVGAAIAWSNPGGFPTGGIASGARDPQYVLIGRDDIFPDNLASGALQGANGPLLLTDTNELDADVIEEIDRLGVDRAIILGEFEAISQDVEDELNEIVSDVTRIGGETRIETAIEVTAANADEVDDDGGGDDSTAILARAFDSDGGSESAAFADSLAAGGWAAEEGYGVLLTQTDTLTESVATYLASGDDIDDVIIVGGEDAVSSDVEAQVAALGISVSRVEGDNRAGTAVAIAEARQDAETDGVILVEGYMDDSWASGFPAAATSALEGYPIVLSNGEALPPETEAYLTGEGVPSNTDGDLVCGPLMPGAGEDGPNDDNVTEDLAPACEQAAGLFGNVDISLAATTVGANDDITGNIRGDVVSLTVSGCGLADGTVVDVDDDGNFTISPPAGGFQADDDMDDDTDDTTCVLTFTATDSAGNEIVRTVTITITAPDGPPDNQTVTDRPELVRASVGATTPGSSATMANPAGTLVTYTFDEPLTSANATNFFVYRSDNTRFIGATVVGFTPGSTMVTVRFTDTFLQSAANAAQLTLATVNDSAVQTSDGDFNPEGDAPIGTASSTTGQPGITNAPDLLTVGGFRAATPSSSTAVDFTFDEAAFLQAAEDFDLIPVNGAGPVECVTSTSATSPSGGSVAGGNGTTVITALCPNTSGTTTLVAADFARGVVGQGSVSDSSTSVTNLNPMQAADVANSGNTIDPDLASAEFQPEATSGTTAVDRVIYVFDQNVATAGASTGFNIYDSAGAPAQDNGTVVQVTGNRVAVDFPNGSLSDAIGASVDVGTVISTTGVGLTNDDDEVGVANTTASTVTPGLTSGPQLTAVALAGAMDATGASVGFRATYTFDEDVDIANFGNFFLYQADGDVLIAQSCSNPTAEDTDNTVTCSFIATGVATSADVQEAVLGTVDFDAVREEGAGAPGLASNPEGGEVTTGGNGTPAS